MQITVFTSNQPRHNALIEALADVADRVFAVQECNTVFPGRVDDFFRKSDVMHRYFERVIAAEEEVFGRTGFRHPRRRPWHAQTMTTALHFPSVQQLPIRMGDLNLLEPDALGPALDSDLFVVFGASFIRGPLCEFLVQREAVNIHMGVSPHYRGSSCNFWALFDNRPELVGATIHRLTAGLDSGPMLLHALPEPEAVDGFLLGMKAVKSAHDALVAAITDGSLLEIEPVEQNRDLKIRYTRNADFTDAIAAEFLQRCLTAEEIAARLLQRDESRLLTRREPAGLGAVKGPTDKETQATPRSANSAARR